MARLARGPSAAARQAISHPPKSMPTTRSRVSAREEPPAASFDAAFGDSFEEPKEPELESYQNTIHYFFLHRMQLSDSLLRLLILSGCAQAGAKTGQKVKDPKGRSKILILVVLSGLTKGGHHVL